MNRRLQQLWRDTVPLGGPFPQADPAAIRRRVNAALNSNPLERSIYMRQKIRFAVVPAAFAVLLAGTALAAASQWNILDFYFEGDTTPGQALVDSQPRSVVDGSYVLTVESSAADPSAALLLVRIDALTQEAAAFMASEDFNGIDLWSIYPVDPVYLQENSDAPRGSGASYSEVEELRTDTSTTWRFRVDLTGMTCTQIRVRMGYMEEGLAITVPIQQAQPLEVPIGATGQGLSWYDARSAGEVTLQSVSLTPLSLQLNITWDAALRPDEGSLPPLVFLMKDGSLRSMGQMLEPIRQGTTVLSQEGDIMEGCWSISFRSVQDLDQMAALVVWGQAYPLDGSDPYPMEVDPSLLPFTIPAVDPQLEEIGYAVPLRALCDGLGIDCVWDNDTQTALLTYRDTTIALTWGSNTALVNGQAVDLTVPVFVVDGGGQVYTTPDGTSGPLCVELFSALEEDLDLWFNLPYDHGTDTYADHWVVYP